MSLSYCDLNISQIDISICFNYPNPADRAGKSGVKMNTTNSEVSVILNEDELVFLTIALNTARFEHAQDVKKFDGFKDLKIKLEMAWEMVVAA